MNDGIPGGTDVRSAKTMLWKDKHAAIELGATSAETGMKDSSALLSRTMPVVFSACQFSVLIDRRLTVQTAQNSKK